MDFTYLIFRDFIPVGTRLWIRTICSIEKITCGGTQKTERIWCAKQKKQQLPNHETRNSPKTAYRIIERNACIWSSFSRKTKKTTHLSCVFKFPCVKPNMFSDKMEQTSKKKRRAVNRALPRQKKKLAPKPKSWGKHIRAISQHIICIRKKKLYAFFRRKPGWRFTVGL